MQLSAKFEGLQIILIEDLHELPFLDVQINPFAINAADWSRAVQADVDFMLKINNFNFKNSHWEPVLEPWKFCIKANQDATDKSTTVSLQSNDLMYMNVTHAFLESLFAISQTLSETKVNIILSFFKLKIQPISPIAFGSYRSRSSKTLPYQELYRL